jgi:hypothetical protein
LGADEAEGDGGLAAAAVAADSDCDFLGIVHLACVVEEWEFSRGRGLKR